MNKRAWLLSEEENAIELKDYKTLKSNNILLKIKSNYNIKFLFSYLKYDNILKLIKNNKSIQNKIGIGKKNYEDYSNIKISSKEIKHGLDVGKIEIIKLFPFIDSIPYEFGYEHPCFICNFLYIIVVFIVELLFPLIALIYYTFYVFVVQQKLNIIWVILINISLFGLMLFRMFYTIFIIFICISEIISVYLLLFFTCIHILYEILVTIKYIIIYKIKKDDIMDALFLIFNFAYIIKNLIHISLGWPKKDIIYKLETYKNILVKPHPIRIKNYKKNKKQYISSISKELKYNYSEEDLEILKIINNFRNKNNLEDLKQKDNIPEFIINEISEVILFNWQHLFKLSNNKYLFKCEIGKFNYWFKNINIGNMKQGEKVDFSGFCDEKPYEIENTLEYENERQKNNKDFINILLKKEINSINIITQRSIQYILLYKNNIDNESIHINSY